jgi:hypothetical protein
VKPTHRTFSLATHLLELAIWPPDDIGIDPFRGRTQLRLVQVVVVYPALDAWIDITSPVWVILQRNNVADALGDPAKTF